MPLATSNKTLLAWYCLLSAATLCGQVLLVRGGWVHPEAETFIPHYLSELPLLQQVFDIRFTDCGFYQGRELSYLLDALDCRFMALCAGLGLPHFLSLGHLVFSHCLGFQLARFSHADLGLSRRLALALSAIWLSSPAVLLGASYYRSAKILSAFFLCQAFLTAYRYLHVPKQGQGLGLWRLVWLGSALTLAGLADRMGLFLALVFIVFSGVRFWHRRALAFRSLLLTGCLSMAAISLYTYFLGPWLTLKVGGTVPSLIFLRFPWSELLSEPKLLKAALGLGPRNAFLGLGQFFGGLPWFLTLCASLALTWMLARRSGVGQRWDLALWQRLLGWFAPLLAIPLMYSLMALRFPVVMQLREFSLVYYPLVIGICAFLALAYALHFLVARHQLRTLWLVVVCGLLAGSNLANLPQHRHLLGTGAYRTQVTEGPRHLLALRQGRAGLSTNPAIRTLAAYFKPEQKP